ncbi:hypothetical protein [Secundilactobacillus folii]|uniref:Uncharacterized protein n=1 Tax=Secundilactobacillus folii TaxID=2678357 RepID=A0A7X2XU93_9LACO|nr:hypothetical protein [Secundilactobacillus folii]MTV81716.1 hypothetical protein [Secundilactobacillus folii]
MSLPELESDEIIDKYDLPSFDQVLDALAFPPATLERDVASQKDFHKKGNNPPSYSNVRSVREVIEDAYDDFVQNLYQSGQKERSNADIMSQFRQKLNQDLATLVVVKNTGRAYLADPNADPIKV